MGREGQQEGSAIYMPPEERVSSLVHDAIPLLEKGAFNSPWRVALMPIAINSRTGNELHLSNGWWFWTNGHGSFDLLDIKPTLGEVLLMYARVVDRRYNSKLQIKRNEDSSDFLRRVREEEAQYLGKNRKWIEPRFVKDLETAVRRLSLSH